MAFKMPWGREETAERLARALMSTGDSYRRGCMSRLTYRSHMASLWGQARVHGVMAEVEAQVDPALVGLRPLGEQRIA
jgi:hypothetical protein